MQGSKGSPLAAQRSMAGVHKAIERFRDAGRHAFATEGYSTLSRQGTPFQ